MLRSLTMLAALALSCGPKKPVGAAGVVAVDPSTLFLQPAPQVTAMLELSVGERFYSGPAHLEIQSNSFPIELSVEDFEIAELTQVRVLSDQPVAYGDVAGKGFVDTGTFVREKDRWTLHFVRETPGQPSARVMILANLAPEAHAPPKTWLAPGTRLFYGLAFDDKPITHIVPQALTVTVGEGAPEGGWAFEWQADLDPATKDYFTGERLETGRRVVSSELAEAGEAHDDRFVPGQDTDATATSLMMSRSGRRNLSAYGAAPWLDRQVSEDPELLHNSGSIQVALQADNAIWTIPATVATLKSGAATYVIADDPLAPLILSAERPGVKMKLMAIGRPSS